MNDSNKKFLYVNFEKRSFGNVLRLQSNYCNNLVYEIEESFKNGRRMWLKITF